MARSGQGRRRNDEHTGEWDIVTSVGITALGVAAARAIETHREEPLVSDPYAARFVRAAKPPNPMPTTPAEAAALVDHEGLWVLNSAYMAVRTRFFDDYFRRATDDGVRQAVILAAGLDSRAFRLDWPQGTAIYEVDQPKVLEFKQEVLDEQGATARGTRRTVPVDLRDNWSAALLDAGFVPDEPTAWLAEGLLPYLPPEAEQLLLDTIDKYSGPGSWLSVEQPIDMARMLDDAQVGDVATQWGSTSARSSTTTPAPTPRTRCARWAGRSSTSARRTSRAGTAGTSTRNSTGCSRSAAT